MWDISIVQNYFDTDGDWEGQDTPVGLESKFDDTEAILTEIREFLKEQGDERPLEIEPENLDILWKEARQDPRQQYGICIRSETYKPTGPNDKFEGTVEIELYLSYNAERAAQTKSTPEPEPKPEPEQLDLFK